MPTADNVVGGDFSPIATLPANPLFRVPTLPLIELDTESAMARVCRDSAKTVPIRRKQYNVKFKCQILNKLNQIKVAHPDISHRQLAKQLNVHRASLARWIKNEPMLKDMKNCNALAVSQEKKSQLDLIEEDLLQWFFDKRANGIKVTLRTLVLHASKLCPIFKGKTFTAKSSCMHRFVKRHNIVNWLATRISSKSPHTVMSEANDFVSHWRKVFTETDRDKR